MFGVIKHFFILFDFATPEAALQHNPERSP